MVFERIRPSGAYDGTYELGGFMELLRVNLSFAVADTDRYRLRAARPRVDELDFWQQTYDLSSFTDRALSGAALARMPPRRQAGKPRAVWEDPTLEAALGCSGPVRGAAPEPRGGT